jgi:dipeptidyl aminopeptidase/acylaminoacyl peptidase
VSGPTPEDLSVPEDVYGSWSASPAPDGDQVAFVSDRSGEPAVWIERSQGQRLTKLPTTLQRVLTVAWSPDGEWLACGTAAAGSSRNEIYVVRPDGRDLHLVAGAEPDTAVLGAGAHHGWTADSRLVVTETVGVDSVALLIDPATGARHEIARTPLMVVLDVAVAANRALLRIGPRGYRHLVVVDLDGSGERPVITGAGEGSVDRGCLSPDGNTVYARTDVGREFAALVAVDVSGAGRAPVLLAARPDAELDDVVPSTDGSCAVLLWNVYGGTSALSLLDLASGRLDEVTPLPRDVVDECRFHPGGKALLMTAEDWADPRGVWTIDLTAAQATPLSSRDDGELRGSREATATVVEAADLTRPQLRRFTSADGLEVTGWLYRPAGPASSAPWPTMIHLHGGPEAQERPVYNSLFQSLVAAGIAVFTPNVRGSTGFGRSFVTADDRGGRYGAIADVAAAVTHLVDSGVADPARVGCMGRSYGGYLTLAALVWHPDLFAVGIDVCGMADFETFYRHTEPRIAAAAVSKYGDPETDAELLRDLSPIHRIDALRAPLLVVHGAEDTNVPVEEARQVVDALAARGVEHRFLLFEGEGHELLATRNRVAFVQAGVAWCSTHLGLP